MTAVGNRTLANARSITDDSKIAVRSSVKRVLTGGNIAPVSDTLTIAKLTSLGAHLLVAGRRRLVARCRIRNPLHAIQREQLGGDPWLFYDQITPASRPTRGAADPTAKLLFRIGRTSTPLGGRWGRRIGPTPEPSPFGGAVETVKKHG